MYSRLDPIFKTQLRHAETLDTRQGIRRHEEQGGKKRDHEKDEEPDEDDLWEDSTTVSIPALKSFLEQLVGSASRKQDLAAEKDISDSDPEHPHSEASSQKSQRAAKAAQAYQRTHRAVHDEERTLPEGSSPQNIELRPEEIRTIHTIIQDLAALSDDGHRELTLQKAESFLQSLVNAVQVSKTG